MKRSKRINHLIRLTCLAGAVFCYSAAGYAEVMSNTALPTGWQNVVGEATVVNGTADNHYTMDVNGITNNVIKWQDFNIGSIATVNFNRDKDYQGAANVLNYVAGGNMSQIHGAMTADNINVYLVNPAGVFIGKSAQVDVGSLYVSNKKIDKLDAWKSGKLDTTIDDLLKEASVPQTSAELMSLGHINATNVTFVGDRIVLDTEYVTNGIDTPIGAENINITTNDANDTSNVVLGFTAYDGSKLDNTIDEVVGYRYKTGDPNSKGVDSTEVLAKVNGGNFTKAQGYMWIEDVEQLQAMNTNVKGNYALRNGIDATNTEEIPFNPINNFEGKLDGLAGRVEGVDFGIFDLHVGDSKNLTDNVGLFGTTKNATIKNLLFVSGSAVGKDNVGMLVGSATGGIIENIKNSGNVTGGKVATSVTGKNIGGIVGSASGTSISDLLNTGAVSGYANVGGVVGSMTNSKLTDARNLGQIRGEYGDPSNKKAHYDLYYSHNIGGLVGNAANASMSDLQNDMTVIGGYNVGGVVGNGENITLERANNTADITANGYCAYQYTYIRFTSSDPNNEFIGPWVKKANVGGIIGSAAGTTTLNNVTNDGGNVASVKVIDSSGKEQAYYEAGNVGGIAGKVEGNTNATSVNITNAVNKENTVYGSHNVGGIAGYLENGTITIATNNGGDIMATGAYGSGYIQSEDIGGRNTSTTKIGNMGGIVGYMYGNNAYISQAGNRGSVHSLYIENHNNIPEAAQAANAGGIVGKIARIPDEDLQTRIKAIKENPSTAAVSDCYNTGDVQGFTGVGGIAGQMFNGEVTGSYNLGHIYTTRRDASGSTPVNMGGIVGESSEHTEARAIVYDVYNSGIIGSEDFDYYARHVGGVVGRLAGYVEKAYNTGAIYNGSNVVGGIVGYVDYGNIKDCFNTGNITVLNRNTGSSATGGIVGGYDLRGFQFTIENVYNLGTVRSFKYNSSSGDNYVGGIIGRILDHDNTVATHASSHLNIKNAYTLGNIYAGTPDGNGGYELDKNAYVGAMYGGFNELNENHVNVSQAYYITPEDEETFGNLSDNNKYKSDRTYLTDTTVIQFEDRMKAEKYGDFVFSKNNGSDGSKVDTEKIDTATNTTVDVPWRIYTFKDENGAITGGTTPILNAFLPDAEEYFSANKDKLGELGVDSLQYGTAYNPTLTIINAKNNADIALDWGEMGIDKGASFAVYDGSLTINNFDTKGNYFGGILYADNALTVKNVDVKDEDGTLLSAGGDIMLGSGSKLYGSSIDIESAGTLTGYGSITSTGVQQSAGLEQAILLQGDTGVELIGTVKSAAKDEETIIYGIDKSPKVEDPTEADKLADWVEKKVNTLEAMPDVAEYYGVIKKAAADANSDIKVASGSGDVDVLLGVAEKGYLNSAGSITLEGNSVYVDSDVSFANDSKFTITADGAALDISNIGKVQAADDKAAISALHAFLGQGENIFFKDGSDAIIAVDMWDDDDKYNIGKYDVDNTNTFNNALRTGMAKHLSKVNIWLENAQQLNNINDAVQMDNNVLTYNFALKNNIDANGLTGFQGIGYGLNTDTSKEHDNFNLAFTGDFDGRGHSIIGLIVTGTENNDFDYVGLFSRIGKIQTGVDAAGNPIYKYGSVKDLNIISSEFIGSSVGAVAGRNEGIIENVTTFGNRVESDEYVKTHIFGDQLHVGAAGGIVGINEGTINNVTASDAVIAGVGGNEKHTYDSAAGGIAGVNAAEIKSSTTNSAITCSSGDANALGGVVGINYGQDALLNIIESWGILNGKYEGIKQGTTNTIEIRSTENVGGIAGVNYNGAAIQNAYNEAHIIGSNGVGGIVGYSGNETNYTGKQNTITNAVNAGNITGSAEGLTGNAKVQNTGGIVGNSQNTNISYARNTGTIHGENNVGGMVGTNGAGSVMLHVTNDGSAAIYGETNVGGIAGVNKGTIDAEGRDLTNNGTIHGNKYVGGVAGYNEQGGAIKYMNSNLTLYVVGQDAQYFGGVAGYNDGLITSATNTGYVNAENAKYVGGIAGINAANGSITGAGNANSGKVIGKSYVGGVAGMNKGQVSGTTDAEGNLTVTEIRNDGYVRATDGGAGGIFGENEKDMTNVELVNNGVVIGKGGTGTGGLIGVNSGNINRSDLIGGVNGVVIGSTRVGGLIGLNYGSVAGGRDQDVYDANGQLTKIDGNYYAHQVYNNGAVVGGNYKETLAAGDNGWTTITVGGATVGYYQATETSSYIGGLVGSNTIYGMSSHSGSLIAAYSTATVMGGQYIGGIVGSSFSDAVIDQVFNAGEVKDSTGKVLNTEGSGTLNGIIGISDVSGYKITNAYDIKSNAVINASENNKDIWKTYGAGDTYGTNKLLKVFLTKIYLDPAKDADGNPIAITYNAHKQSIVVQAENGVINVYNYDGVTKDEKGNDKPILLGTIKTTSTDAKAAHSLADYLNTSTDSKDSTGNTYALSALLSGNDLVKNGETVTSAGAYEMFASQQIITDSKNTENTHGPNNLGFDVVSGNVDPTQPDDGNGNIINAAKAKVNLTLNDVYRIYGDLALLDKNLAPVSDYGYVIDKTNLNDEMLKELDGLSVTMPSITGDARDKALDNSSGEWRTKGVNNGDPYSWMLTAALSDDLAKNYTFGENTSNSKDFKGNSYVKPKALTVDNILAEIVYGNNDSKVEWQTILQNLANKGTLDLVYDDNITLDYSKATATTEVNKGVYSEYEDSRDGRFTADVKTTDGGVYKDSLQISNIALSGDSSKFGNYIFDGTASGSIKVNKANIELSINDIDNIIYGATTAPAYSYKVIKDAVNGDKLTELFERIDYTSEGFANGKTGNVGNYGINGKGDAAATSKVYDNYNVAIKPGTLTINQKELTVTLNDVVRIYGSEKLKEGTADYGISSITGWAYDEKVKLEGEVKLNSKTISDKALTGNTTGKITNDANKLGESYDWSAKTVDNKALSNYTITVVVGDSKVEKANLELRINDIDNMIYGATTAPAYSYEVIKDAVNGDELTKLFDRIDYTSDGFANGKTGNIGKYGINGKGVAAATSKVYDNYNVTIKPGTLTINPKELTVTLNDVVRIYGSKELKEGTADYGISGITGWAYDEKDKLEGEVELNHKTISDKALTGNATGKITKDANKPGESYAWSAKTVDNTALGNYAIKVVDGDSKVEKANLELRINDIDNMIYGATTAPEYNYEVIKDAVNGDKLNDLLGHVVYDTNGIKDNGRTNNVGSYYITGQAVAADGSNLYTNYNVQVNQGTLTINPKELTVTLNDVVRIYGSKELKKGTADYGISGITGWAYDEKATLEDKVELNRDRISDEALTGNTTGKVTNGAGSYTWFAETLANTALGNYKISVVKGNSTVEKAQLTIVIYTPEPIKPGDKVPDFTGTKIEDELTNGDYFDYEYGVQPGTDLSKDGNHTIGIIIDGKYYDTDSSLNDLPFLSDNYEYTITTGNLTVKAPDLEPEPVPTLPDIWEAEDKYPWYQWDKQRNERERKAEVHFVDGGMAIH